jgi:uroporphyrinogen-III decarboxylase
MKVLSACAEAGVKRVVLKSSTLVRAAMPEADSRCPMFDFSEPIGGNHGPLISPKMYSSIILKSYRPIIEALNQHGVSTLIYRTYANTRLLLPGVVKAGFNCLWACETNPEAMDYKEIRKEFGKELRLIGGIDSDSLRHNKEEIERSIIDIVPALLESGGI